MTIREKSKADWFIWLWRRSAVYDSSANEFLVRRPFSSETRQFRTWSILKRTISSIKLTTNRLRNVLVHHVALHRSRNVLWPVVSVVVWCWWSTPCCSDDPLLVARILLCCCCRVILASKTLLSSSPPPPPPFLTSFTMEGNS